MKKLLLFLAAVSLNCYSQMVTENNFMQFLPRTTDDFQKYQFSYALENGVYMESTNFAYSHISTFDNVGIYPFEYKGNVQSITFEEYNKESQDLLTSYGKMTFSQNGEVRSYEGKSAEQHRYAFGADRWSQIVGKPLELPLCVPNSFAYKTKPTRNAKGLITNVENELKYTYDNLDRVIEVKYRNGEYLYQYSYVGDSKNIQTIKVLIYGELRADAVYSYSNGLISSLYTNLYNRSGSNVPTEKFEKHYKYDSHNNYSEVKFINNKVPAKMTTIKVFDNNYDSSGRIISSNVSYTHFTSFDGNRSPSRAYYTREYTYDSKGNWIKISEGDKGYIVREIKYGGSTKELVGSNYVFSTDEVDQKANFGYTLKGGKQWGLPSYMTPRYFEENLPDGCRLDIDLIVEKDGRMSNLKFYNSANDGNINSNAKDYFSKLSWIPAVKDGMNVRSQVSMSVYYYMENDHVYVQVLKDIELTEAEILNYKKYQFSKTLKEAESGDIVAKRSVARAYAIGEEGVVEKDMQKALKLFADLAVKGDLEGQLTLVHFKSSVEESKELMTTISKAYNSKTCDINTPWGNLCCLSAATCGDVNAMLQMAEGFKGKNDFKEAITWYEKAVSKNNIDAMFGLGGLYLDQTTNYTNIERGIELYTKAAEEGHIDARLKLGRFYKYGINVKKDKKKAKQYLGENYKDI